MPGQQAFRTADQGVENALHTIGREAGKHSTAGAKHVGERPAGNHAVIGQDQETGNDTGPPQPLPVRTGVFLDGKNAHGIDRAAAATPADQYLGHHDRYADHRDTGQVDQHEGATTVFAGDIGELPDITQTDGRTGCRQYECQPA